MLLVLQIYMTGMLLSRYPFDPDLCSVTDGSICIYFHVFWLPSALYILSNSERELDRNIKFACFVLIVFVIHVGFQFGSGYKGEGGWSTRLSSDWSRNGHSHMDDIILHSTCADTTQGNAI